MAALAKVIIAMEDGMIPANLHYKEPNPDISGLLDGRLKVVTERLRWNGGYVGINSFGFGGSNVHALLRSYPTEKPVPHPASDMARLVTFAGRTEQAIYDAMEIVKQRKHDVDFQALLQETILLSTNNKPYRGYAFLNMEDTEIHIEVKTITFSCYLNCSFVCTLRCFMNTILKKNGWALSVLNQQCTESTI